MSGDQQNEGVAEHNAQTTPAAKSRKANAPDSGTSTFTERLAHSAHGLWHSSLTAVQREGTRNDLATAAGPSSNGKGAQRGAGLSTDLAATAGWDSASGASTSTAAAARGIQAGSWRSEASLPAAPVSARGDQPATSETNWRLWRDTAPANTEQPYLMGDRRLTPNRMNAMMPPMLPEHPPTVETGFRGAEQDGIEVFNLLMPARHYGGQPSTYTDAVYGEDACAPETDMRPLSTRETVAGLSVAWVQSFSERWHRQQADGATGYSADASLSPAETYLVHLLETLEHGAEQAAASDQDILVYLNTHRYVDEVYGDDLLPAGVAQGERELRCLLRQLASTKDASSDNDIDHVQNTHRQRALDRLRQLHKHLRGAL